MTGEERPDSTRGSESRSRCSEEVLPPISCEPFWLLSHPSWSMTFTPCSERELYWNFACAEANSPRYGKVYEQLPSPLLERIRGGKRDELTEQDWRVVTGAVRALRGPVINQLIELGTDWYETTLQIAALEQVRLLNFAPFVQLAPSRDLGAFATALDAGFDPPGDEGFGRNYRQFRKDFVASRMVGRPIVVAPAKMGPYTEIEGLTRMCSLVSQHAAGEAVPPVVPVLLGVCLQYDFWSWK